MKRLAILLFASLTIAGCATTGVPKDPAGFYASARVTHHAVCSEVERLHNAGLTIAKAIDACIAADDALDAAGVAIKVGKLAEGVDGTQRALILIAAAQAVLVAANGGVR